MPRATPPGQRNSRKTQQKASSSMPCSTPEEGGGGQTNLHDILQNVKLPRPNGQGDKEDNKGRIRLDKLLNKTQLCVYNEQGTCRFGKQCTFAHSAKEMRRPPDLAKTMLCKAYFKGKCNDPTCTYAHGHAELRSLAKAGVTRSQMLRRGDGYCQSDGATALRANDGATSMQLQETRNSRPNDGATALSQIVDGQMQQQQDARQLLQLDSLLGQMLQQQHPDQRRQQQAEQMRAQQPDQEQKEFQNLLALLLETTNGERPMERQELQQMQPLQLQQLQRQQHSNSNGAQPSFIESPPTTNISRSDSEKSLYQSSLQPVSVCTSGDLLDDVSGLSLTNQITDASTAASSGESLGGEPQKVHLAYELDVQDVMNAPPVPLRLKAHSDDSGMSERYEVLPVSLRAETPEEMFTEDRFGHRPDTGMKVPSQRKQSLDKQNPETNFVGTKTYSF